MPQPRQLLPVEDGGVQLGTELGLGALELRVVEGGGSAGRGGGSGVGVGVDEVWNRRRGMD